MPDYREYQVVQAKGLNFKQVNVVAMQGKFSQFNDALMNEKVREIFGVRYRLAIYHMIDQFRACFLPRKRFCYQ